MIVSQVECDLRKEVLRRMQETKQSHFNDVLNGYTGTEEEGRGRLTPDISLESKVCIPYWTLLDPKRFYFYHYNKRSKAFKSEIYIFLRFFQ